MANTTDTNNNEIKQPKTYYYKSVDYYKPYIDLVYYISHKYGHSILNVNKAFSYLYSVYEKLVEFGLRYDCKYHIIIHTSNVANCNFNYYYRKFDRVLRIDLKVKEFEEYIILFICEEKYEPEFCDFVVKYEQDKHVIGLLYCISVAIYHEYELLSYFDNNRALEYRPLDSSGKAFYYTVTYTNTDRLKTFNIYSARLKCIFAEEYIFRVFKDMINLLK
jgi:hypothetical protein